MLPADPPKAGVTSQLKVMAAEQRLFVSTQHSKVLDWLQQNQPGLDAEWRELLAGSNLQQLLGGLLRLSPPLSGKSACAS
jgi:hypothetical protein